MHIYEKYARGLTSSSCAQADQRQSGAARRALVEAAGGKQGLYEGGCARVAKLSQAVDRSCYEARVVRAEERRQHVVGRRAAAHTQGRGGDATQERRARRVVHDSLQRRREGGIAQGAQSRGG